MVQPDASRVWTRDTHRDLRWYCPPSHTSIDEFTDDTRDAAWVEVYPAGRSAAVAWTELGDVQSANVSSGGSSGDLQALVRPLSGVGGTVAVGDAFITALTVSVSGGNSYTMGGIVLSDGATAGSGNQLAALCYPGTPNGLAANNTIWSYTGFNAATNLTANGSGMVGVQWWARLVRLSSTTWRHDFSSDGVSWIQGTVATKTITPTHVGVCATAFGTAYNGTVTFECLRRVTGVT